MMNNDIPTEEEVALMNSNLVETLIRLLGDATTISQIVLLLAYIRHVVLNNQKFDINVKLGRNVVNTLLVMDVNGQEVKDYIAKNEIEIN